MSKFALHAVQDTGRDQGAERIANQTAARQHTSANSELGTLVPLRKQEKGTREERSLHESEEEPGKKRADEADGRISDWASE